MRMTDARSISFTPIGFIRTPFDQPKGMPIQAAYAPDVEGTVELDVAYTSGLKDLDGFSHIMLLYHFHRSAGYALQVKPFLDDEERGIFAVRAPRRPNPIGLSVVRLERVEGNVLFVRGVDMLDGTPLLDIKPFVPAFDTREVERVGWLAGRGEAGWRVQSDGRFAKEDG
jgi:tRNA (adenine37-N6)-methyltransferase